MKHLPVVLLMLLLSGCIVPGAPHSHGARISSVRDSLQFEGGSIQQLSPDLTVTVRVYCLPHDKIFISQVHTPNGKTPDLQMSLVMLDNSYPFNKEAAGRYGTRVSSDKGADSIYVCALRMNDHRFHHKLPALALSIRVGEDQTKVPLEVYNIKHLAPF